MGTLVLAKPRKFTEESSVTPTEKKGEGQESQGVGEEPGQKGF